MYSLLLNAKIKVRIFFIFNPCAVGYPRPLERLTYKWSLYGASHVRTYWQESAILSAFSTRCNGA